MKKVLISLDDITKILGCEGKTFYKGCLDSELLTLKYFEEWFDAQPDASQWISVEDRLPESFIMVAIGFADDDEYWLEAQQVCGGWCDRDGCPLRCKPTHWMPITPLSKIETTGGKDDN